MSVILVLIGFSLLVAGIFLAAFIWAVRDGQYDDHYGSSVRILFDDERKEEKKADDPPAEKSTAKTPATP
jgi:cbb3-type cytochrome oxidase maturation protein